MNRALWVVAGLAASWLVASHASAQGYGDALVTGMEAARRRACANNIEQIGVALVMYANDHDEAFPKTFGELLKGGYITQAKILHCPSDAKSYKEPERHDFKNMEVAEIDKLIEPILSYTLIEGVDHKSPGDAIALTEKDGAHKGVGRNVFYVDGTIKWLVEEDFQKKLAGQKKRSGDK